MNSFSSMEYGSDDNCADYPKISEKLEVPKEWTYTMRRSMQEVVQGLFLGPYSAATKSKLDSLLEHGITHIVCVRQDIEAHFIKPNFPDKFKYLVLDIADNATENIIKHFKKVKSFIDEALNSGGKVLVHGNAGISRSAALVIAYLMETFGLKQEKAYSILQQRRFCINPNDGFMAQLREYEPIYQAEKSLPNGQETLTNQRSKRTLHMTDGDHIDDRQDTMDSSLSN
ncbi:serine/threonine/tyrosine-interacting protein isoform X2 [Nasonia vitripennis]|uniref:Serine/threonine/tyrosine-interacting protein n=1 Tax=Nasonia vitripennis TaxID=7425 RepID=A0A7M7QRT9_NASVI|nr:serine/threonine/tyrosine-interacting protein isoform X2 [Nasonia vitripennis]